MRYILHTANVDITMLVSKDSDLAVNVACVLKSCHLYSSRLAHDYNVLHVLSYIL